MLYHSSQLTAPQSRGFTLVEMLVVLGLFSFIMTLATGVLYSTQAINVKLQASQAVLDNVNISMDTMSRDIRYGFDFHCGANLPPAETKINLRKSCRYSDAGLLHGGKSLFFKPADAVSDSDRVSYYASTTSFGNVILKDEYTKNIVTGITSTTTYQITANDVKITSLVFYVEGANTGTGNGVDVDEVHDYVQPLITLMISGETIPIKQNGAPTPFAIQTSISSRGIDR